MRRIEMIEDLVNKLFPYTNKEMPITKGSFNLLEVHEIKEFYEFLNSSPVKIKDGERPEFPFKKGLQHLGKKPTYHYKKSMNNYLYLWNFKFENPISVPPTLFEATANFLESENI